MVNKIWKLILIWISVLCLSSVACIMFALETGLMQETYFSSGYVISTLICIMMFCTLLSVILKNPTQLYDFTNNNKIRKNISKFSRCDLASDKTDKPLDAEYSVIKEQKKVSTDYDNTSPTKEECEKFDKILENIERSDNHE